MSLFHFGTDRTKDGTDAFLHGGMGKGRDVCYSLGETEITSNGFSH